MKKEIKFLISFVILAATLMVMFIMISTSDYNEEVKDELKQQVYLLQLENEDLQHKVDSLEKYNEEYLLYIKMLSKNTEDSQYKSALTSIMLLLPSDIWETYILPIPEIEELYFNIKK